MKRWFMASVRIVALGGTPVARSSTERVLAIAAEAAKDAGADIITFAESNSPACLTI